MNKGLFALIVAGFVIGGAVVVEVVDGPTATKMGQSSLKDQWSTVSAQQQANWCDDFRTDPESLLSNVGNQVRASDPGVSEYDVDAVVAEVDFFLQGEC